jgi:hypothetical protein
MMKTLIRLAAACAVVAPSLALAQSSLTIGTQDSTTKRVAPGTAFTVPVVLDMHAAGGGAIDAVTSTINWNPAVITLDSVTAGSFGSFTRLAPIPSSGILDFDIAASGAQTASVTLATLYFTAGQNGGGTRLSFSNDATNGGYHVAHGQVVGWMQDICVAPPGKWGDTDGDGTVTIIDAQQIAKAAVGASVADSTRVANNGDVNGDGVVDILDAQGIARFVVALSAPARIDQDRGGVPNATTLTINQGPLNVPAGSTTALVATPSDANGTLVGCQSATWTTNNTAVAVVNGTGQVTATGPGTTTITATTGGATAQLPVTVTIADSTSVFARLRTVTAGGDATQDGVWQLGGMLSDEWKSSESDRITIDRRSVSDGDTFAKTTVRELLHLRTDARTALSNLVAAPAAVRGQMLFAQGYAELMLAENFCNGIPLSSTSGGLTIYGPTVTNAAAYDSAVVHFTAAIAALGGAVDQRSVALAGDAAIAKGRALLERGDFPGAAAAVNGVATGFIDLSSTLASGESNKGWLFNSSRGEYSIGDTADAPSTHVPLPFATSGDGRLPASLVGTGSDAQTPLFTSTRFVQATATPLFSGVDARLIEAELQYNNADYAGMITTLNSLRASAQNLGAINSPVLTPLSPAPSVSAALDTLMGERAYWAYGRGQRLGDLRRLVRVYGRTQATVFPSGNYFKFGGTYGVSTSFPAAVDEEGNALRTVCIDRNP